MKITKTAIKNFLKTELGCNSVWAKKALIRIYDYQTSAEQNSLDSLDRNYVGFTGADAFILSSFANQFLERGFLSTKQMSIVYKKMPKYWQQIWNLSDQNKLVEMISKNQE